MGSWWHREIIVAGKLPLMLCFLAFVVTFVLTRTITRLIRDGRGPFKNNVTAGGAHIHHAVPGIILLIVAAVYFLVPADQLPSFFPGHEAVSRMHYKHGIAAGVLGLVLLIAGQFLGRR